MRLGHPQAPQEQPPRLPTLPLPSLFPFSPTPQGVVSKPAFHKFGVNDMRPAPGKPGDGNAAARAFLGDRLLQHYWDLAAAYTPE